MTAILQSAGAGTAVMVLLILFGILSPRTFVQRLEREADGWQAAYETERSAHDETRRTLGIQTQRADAAVEAAKLTGELLNDLRRRRDASAEA